MVHVITYYIYAIKLIKLRNNIYEIIFIKSDRI